ncbi:MAG: hypothetical protein WC385_02315 [Candidatus Paceibacterota bacterium]
MIKLAPENKDTHKQRLISCKISESEGHLVVSFFELIGKLLQVESVSDATFLSFSFQAGGYGRDGKRDILIFPNKEVLGVEGFENLPTKTGVLFRLLTCPIAQTQFIEFWQKPQTGPPEEIVLLHFFLSLQPKK